MDTRPNRRFSIRELHESPQVNPQDLVETFENYVQTGAAIKAEPIIDIIKRTPVELIHLGTIGEGISIGLNDQQRRGFPLDAAEYAKLGEFVSKRMTEMFRDQR
jgi:hypothetical protein